MCNIGKKTAKFIDPGGFIAEKTAPKAFAPYSGLHGTVSKMEEMNEPVQSQAAMPLVSAGLTPEQKKAQNMYRRPSLFGKLGG